EDVHLDDNWNQVWEVSAFADAYVRQFGGGGGLDPDTWSASKELAIRHEIRNYAAGALFMDAMLGRVLDALAASTFANDTVVTFYSDHGYHLGDRNRWHKFTLYEQAARAPMIIKVPGQTP